MRSLLIRSHVIFFTSFWLQSGSEKGACEKDDTCTKESTCQGQAVAAQFRVPSTSQGVDEGGGEQGEQEDCKWLHWSHFPSLEEEDARVSWFSLSDADTRSGGRGRVGRRTYVCGLGFGRGAEEEEGQKMRWTTLTCRRLVLASSLCHQYRVAYTIKLQVCCISSS